MSFFKVWLKSGFAQVPLFFRSPFHHIYALWPEARIPNLWIENSKTSLRRTPWQVAKASCDGQGPGFYPCSLPLSNTLKHSFTTQHNTALPAMKKKSRFQNHPT